MTENITEGTTHWIVLSDRARQERNKLLAETDWWGMSDVTMSEGQTLFRQNLRDISLQEGWPHTIEWPNKP